MQLESESGVTSTILVVDDIADNLALMTSLLKIKYKVKIAKSGEKALAIAAELPPPDLILLDIMMPNMDGYEVCRRIQANPATRQIPVIFLTAKSEVDDEAKGLELGAVDYITKPISPPIVMARVKTQLALSRSLTELRQSYATIAKQNRRMQQELAVGREIQLAMVPTEFPHNVHLTTHALLQPTLEVGGDFYDIFMIGNRHLYLCVGDVSGKGVPAALFMSMSKTLLQAETNTTLSTAEIVNRANKRLCQNNEGCLFITLFVAILDIETGVLTTTNAGHPPPLIKQRNGSVKWLNQRNGPVAAATDDVDFNETRHQLQPGDQLLIYTDGITEAQNTSSELFGEQRLQDWFAAWYGESMKSLIKDLADYVHKYESGCPQADDITLMGLHYHG